MLRGESVPAGATGQRTCPGGRIARDGLREAMGRRNAPMKCARVEGIVQGLGNVPESTRALAMVSRDAERSRSRIDLLCTRAWPPTDPSLTRIEPLGMVMWDADGGSGSALGAQSAKQHGMCGAAH